MNPHPRFGQKGIHTLAGSIKRLHIEHVNAPHLSEQFQSLKTCSLLEITGNLTGLTSGGKEVIFGLHLCIVSKDFCVSLGAYHFGRYHHEFGVAGNRLTSGIGRQHPHSNCHSLQGLRMRRTFVWDNLSRDLELAVICI